MDGLDSLLSDLPGFRKQSLADLKAQHATAVQASSGTRAAAANPRNGSSAALPAASSQGLDGLDAAIAKSRSSPALAQQRAPSASASSSSLSNMAAAPSAGGAGAFDDLLSGLPGSTIKGGASMRKPAAATPASSAAAAPQPAAVPAAVPPAAPAAVQLPDVSGPPPTADEDPFAMFGGPPPATASSAAAAPVTDIDDGFLAAFAAPAQQQTQQHAAPQAQVQPAAAGAAGSHDFGDFLGSDDHEAFAAPAAAPPAPAPAAAASSGRASPERPARSAASAASGSSFSGRPPAGPTAEFGFERPTSAASAGQPRYRVFDYVEPLPDSPSEAQAAAAAPSAAAARPPSRGAGGLPSDGPLADGLRRASGGSAGLTGSSGGAAGGGAGGGVLHAGSYHQPPAGAKEVVNDLGHKAAKALQSGTKWFMRASKTLVSQVQHRLEHGAVPGQGGAAGTAGPAGRPRPSGSPGEPAPFHYDWAAQLARVSPNSRAAALGAMAEDDRLAVQRVLDESVLGDSYMEGPEYDGIATPAGQQRAQQPGPAAAAAAAAQGGRPAPPRSSSRPGAPAAAAAAAAAGPEGRRPSSSATPPSYGQLFGGEAGQPSASPQPSPAKAPAAAKPAAAEDDLLGMGSSGSGPRPPAAAAAAPAAAAAVDDDLLGFGGNGGSGAAPAAASSSTAHIDDLFTVPSAKPKPGAGPAARPAPRPAPAPRSSGSRGAGLDSMIDLGADLPAVDTSGFEDMYEAELEAGAGDEPEERRALRLRRIQEKHARMQQQLAEQRARDEAEEAERSGKVELRGTLKPKIDAWAAGKKDNIRALLASLHTVLWEGSGWTPPSMADMVENAKVKRVYMKANLVVHPDKVKQKGGTLEQIAIADMIFDVLKVAWGKFEASGK